MSVAYNDFWNYVEQVDEDEETGEGGNLIIKDNAPESAKLAFEEYQKMQADAKARGIKV